MKKIKTLDERIKYIEHVLQSNFGTYEIVETHLEHYGHDMVCYKFNSNGIDGSNVILSSSTRRTIPLQDEYSSSNFDCFRLSLDNYMDSNGVVVSTKINDISEIEEKVFEIQLRFGNDGRSTEYFYNLIIIRYLWDLYYKNTVTIPNGYYMVLRLISDDFPVLTRSTYEY